MKRNPFVLIFIGTLFSLFWGRQNSMPDTAKFVFGLLVFLSYAFLDWGKSLRFFRSERMLSLCGIVLTFAVLIAVFQTLLVFDFSHAKLGNKYISLFGNELTLPAMLLPFFMYYSRVEQIKIIAKYLLICILFGTIFMRRDYSFYCVAPFFLILNKKSKFLLFLNMTMIVVFYGRDVRNIIILVALSLFSVLSPYLCKYRKMALISVMLFPIVILLSMFLYDQSIFSLLQEYLINNQGIEKEGGEIDISDSRTFLYNEAISSLIHDDSILTGYGAHSGYTSVWFDVIRNTSIEVPVLALLLKGGLIYIIPFLIITYRAIYMAFFKSNNDFMKIVAFMLAGWILDSCIGDISGVRMFNVAMWAFVGCCYRQEWLDYTDAEIQAIFKSKKK